MRSILQAKVLAGSLTCRLTSVMKSPPARRTLLPCYRSAGHRLFSLRVTLSPERGWSNGFEWNSNFVRCLMLLSWMTSCTIGIPRSLWIVSLVTYRGASTFALNILDWNLNDFERRSYGLRYYTGILSKGTEEVPENLNKASRYAGQISKQVPPEYNRKALPLNHLFDIRRSTGSFFVEVSEDAAWCCHALREIFLAESEIWTAPPLVQKWESE